ncbi:MAG: type IV pilus assembly protein PilY1 [Candidatus Azotimanducaceae bacterium]|jgi:type IV pilus assembly protein PilY1
MNAQRLIYSCFLAGTFSAFNLWATAPIKAAALGTNSDRVQYKHRLAQSPLELPIWPEPNVLIINDDSGSMRWDISTSQTDGIYNYSASEWLTYVLKASAVRGFDQQFLASSEDQSPRQGLWRLRNARYNRTYYNPVTQYLPWAGRDSSGQEYLDSPPERAKHNPVVENDDIASWTNLNVPQSYTGRAIITSKNCQEVCIAWRGTSLQCLAYEPLCTDTGGFKDVEVSDYYVPRHYVWEDKDGDGQLSAKPTPKDGDPIRYQLDGYGFVVKRVGGNAAEGRKVEIKRHSDGGSDYYPKSRDRTDCQTQTHACTFEEELQNFANWFTYGRTRESTVKSALGQWVADAENIRMGYAKLNNRNNDQQRIKSVGGAEDTGAKADLLNSIYRTTSFGGTPLRQTLQKAGRYFACEADDIFDASLSWDKRKADCPILTAPEGNCQRNFALLLTDGTWNGDAPPGISDEDDGSSNPSSAFDGGAYEGLTNVSGSLADVAMYYYENDLAPCESGSHFCRANEVPTTARDVVGASATAFEHGDNKLMHQHMSTYTVGFGVQGGVLGMPGSYTDLSFAWGDPLTSSPAKIDDVRHAAYNGRGDYLNVTNAADLFTGLEKAFEQYAQGSGAGSAVSVNAQKIQNDSVIFRAFYNTKNNVGNLIAQSLTETGLLENPVWESAARMDNVAAKNREIITLDRIGVRGIPFRGGIDTLLNADQRYVFVSDAAGSPAQQNIELTERINYLRGDQSLEQPSGKFRERPATGGLMGDVVHSAPVFLGPPDRLGRHVAAYPQGDANSYSQFRDAYVGRTKAVFVGANDGMLHGFNATNGKELFAYVPDNLMTGAFSQRITKLLDDDYSHRFYVDLTPALNDVFMDLDGDSSTVLDRQWTTLLVGGHGAGAKAYFALNVTDTNNLDEAHAADIAMWEFTDADDTYPTNRQGSPLRSGNAANADGSNDDNGAQRRDLQSVPQPVKDLGYSFSVPTLAMSNVVTNGEHEWVAMFGNGPNSTAGYAKLFLLFVSRGVDGTWCHPDMRHNSVMNGPMPAGAARGYPCSTPKKDGTPNPEGTPIQDFVKIDTEHGAQDGYPNGLGTPRGIDVDHNGTLDYAYAGDTFGNVYRFDLRSSNFSDWRATKIFEAVHVDANSIVTRQQVTTQPLVTAHLTEAEGYLVVFGTGSYMTVPDGSSTSIQSIYGLWDRPWSGVITRDELVRQSYTNFADERYGTLRTLSSNEVDYSVTGGRKGWYIDLDSVAVGGVQGIDPPQFAGERASRNIQARGGRAFVNSIVPSVKNSCVNVAGGFALAFCPDTGSDACFSANGVFELTDGASLGPYGRAVAGMRFKGGVPTDSSFIGGKRMTQLSDKSIAIVGTRANRSSNAGRLSWRRLDATD